MTALAIKTARDFERCIELGYITLAQRRAVRIIYCDLDMDKATLKKFSGVEKVVESYWRPRAGDKHS